MEKNFEILNFKSFNCRGLREKNKQSQIFAWLKSSHRGIILLQETHSSTNDEQIWKKDWDGDILYSHGSANSRGVAILLPKDIDTNFEITSIQRDLHGRILIIECKIESQCFIIVNVYAPTKDKAQEQLLFLKNLQNLLDTYSGNAIIIGGDFNTYLNVSIDKKGGTSERQSEYSQLLQGFCQEMSLTDIWRIRHENIPGFTRRQRTKLGLVQSRLDLWLISVQLEYHVKCVKIAPGKSSDHSIISLELELMESHKRGKGLWKFNNDLLTDPIYVQLIKDTIGNIKDNMNFENKNTLWDYVKCEIRSQTIIYSTKKAKQMRKQEIELSNRLNLLEKNLSNNPDDNTYVNYLQCKQEWESLIKKKTEAIILRSKAKWVEEGEKNSKFFLNLEKRNYNNKYIKKLISGDNRELTNLKDIIEEEKLFYKTLYTRSTRN